MTPREPRIDEQRRRDFERARLAGKGAPLESFLPLPADPCFLDTLEELCAIELDLGWKAPGAAGCGCR